MPTLTSLRSILDGLSLRTKLALGFAIMIGLTLVVSLMSLRSDYRTLEALKSYLDTEKQVAERSLESKASMNKARRYEKDFLLKVRKYGFYEAKSRYAMLVLREIERIREDMATVRRLRSDSDTLQTTQEIERLSDAYAAGFMDVVELHGTLGRLDTGLQGEFRAKAQAMETLITRYELRQLMVDLRTLRRHEREFLLRDQEKYALALYASADRFRTEAEFTRLQPAVQTTLTQLLDGYVATFQRYAQTIASIDEATERYLATVNTVEPLLEKLYATTQNSAAATLQQTQALARTSAWTAVGTGWAALLLGALVAALLSRNVNRAVRRCMDFAVHIGRGDLSTRMPLPRGHEFSVLGRAMNDMADALLEQQAAVSRLNRTLRVLSECNQVLVRADSEPALLDSICRHIVDIGGYDVAFVAYAQEPPSAAWHRVAHACASTAEIPQTDDGGGPTGPAIRTARLAISHARLSGNGPATAIALPLMAASRVLGALTLYSRDAKAFDADEVTLLNELADDLAFGIVTLRTRRARQQAEAALRLRERAIESSHNGIVISDLGQPRTPIVYVNPAFERMTGYTAAEAIGRNSALLLGRELEPSAPEERRAAPPEPRAGQTELRNRRKDGSLFWTELTVAPVHDEQGRATHLVSVINDITERKAYEAQLAHQATHDALTGLANRTLLMDRLQQAMLHANAAKRRVALLLLDLDRFKFINDSLGHLLADTVLAAVAERLQTCVQPTDTVARLGGDEFVVVLGDLARADDAVPVARAILAALASANPVAGQELYLSASIGISVYPDDALSEDPLLKYADAAMYQAKTQGGGCVCFHAADLHAKAARRMALEMGLRQALERQELALHYQPKVDLRSGCITGMEALLRWQSLELGAVSPAEFIPVAEESGLILPLGEWVLKTACAQVQTWLAAGLAGARVAVNLSPRQFHRPDLVERVRRILRETGLDPARLELELTESMMVDNPDRAEQMLRQLKAIGLQLSLDDFGTGASNLSHLRRFPIDTLKIDQSFVRDITSDPDNGVIAVAVISLAHSLKRKVIAEGVETQAQLDYLRAHGCDEIQGYLVSRPLPADACEALLRQPPPLAASGMQTAQQA